MAVLIRYKSAAVEQTVNTVIAVIIETIQHII